MAEATAGELRDEKLRRSLLNAARTIGKLLNGGWVGGATLADEALDDQARKVDDDEHARRLIADLVDLGLLEEERSMHNVPASRPLRHRRFRLTAKGFALWRGDDDMPPVPGVADPRWDK